MQKRKEIVELIKKLCDEIDKSSLIEKFDHKKIWIKNGLFIGLTEPMSNIFKEIIDNILIEKKIKEHIPRDYIESIIQDLITNTIILNIQEREKYIQVQCDELEETLQKESIEYQAFIPIENLIISNPIIIGEVKFYQLSETKSKEIIQYFEEIIDNNPKLSPDKENILGLFYPFFSNEHRPYIYTIAEVSSVGILDVSTIENMKKVRMACNIIRFYGGIKIREFSSHFGIEGDIIRKSNRCILRIPKNIKEINPIIENTGYNASFNLDQEFIDYINENHKKTIDEILLKSNKSELDEKILNSIYWYGEALCVPILYAEKKMIFDEKKKSNNFEHYYLNDALLKTFISLESLLVFDKSEPITNNISERVAFLIGDEFEQRMEIKKFIKKLYENRSQIVHHGLTVILIGDLYLLQNLTQKTIFNIIHLKEQSKIQSMQDLKDYLDKLKFS